MVVFISETMCLLYQTSGYQPLVWFKNLLGSYCKYLLCICSTNDLLSRFILRVRNCQVVWTVLNAWCIYLLLHYETQLTSLQLKVWSKFYCLFQLSTDQETALQVYSRRSSKYKNSEGKKKRSQTTQNMTECMTNSSTD